MSIRVQSHIWLCDLPPNELVFLQAIGDCADDDYLAHPSWSYLAWKTGLSRRTVAMFVKKFRENGTLTPVGAITRGGVVYHIRLDALPQKQPWRLKRKPWRTDGESTGATAAPVVQVASPSRLVQTATSTGAKHDSAIRKNHHLTIKGTGNPRSPR